MDTIGETLQHIFVNGKLNHFCCDKKWYIDNNKLDIYDLILKNTTVLNNTNPTLRERIFYIENGFNKIIMCKYCGVNKLKFLSNKVRLANYCNSGLCKKKHISEFQRNRHSNMTHDTKAKLSDKIKKSLSSYGNFIRNKTLEEIHGVEKSFEIKNKISTSLSYQTIDTKNKRVKSRKENNLVWHSQDTKNKISISNKKTHNSQEFKNKYKSVYLKSRTKISNTIKEKILTGQFTPCITNSWTKWKSYIKDENGNTKKFRSNWDAAFWLLNKTCEYEKVRIKYNFNGENKIYIVDFCDVLNKKLYEIKPDSLKNNQKNIVKKQSAINWCNDNGYEYISVGDDWFKNNCSKIDFSLHPNLKNSFKKFL